MATFNGAKYLPEQLDSIAAQTFGAWSLWVGDDGSTDETEQILQEFGAKGHPLHIRQSGGFGSATNFMSLLANLPSVEGAPDWIAFTDQDDVWLPDKLERGVTALRQYPDTTPALYCSRTWVTNSTLTRRVPSAPMPRQPSFKNALVQNIAAGNTILLNPAAAELVRAAASEAGPVVMHDWWVYLLVTGAGGIVEYDNTPTLLYRQHARNVIGANLGVRARLRRIAMVLNGEFRRRNDVNLAALGRSAHRLIPANRDIVRSFSEARQSSLLLALAAMLSLGLYRQTTASTWALWCAVLLRRV